MRFLCFLFVVLAACSSDRAAPRRDGSMPADSGALRLDARPLPSSCPCPTESYCDLATNRCVAGCGVDGDCGEGRICEDRACRAGCRADDECAASEICDDDELVCRDGCRSDADCGGSVCDETTLTCRRGCRTQSDCPAEQLCDEEAATCVGGCVDDEGCRDGRICEAGACRSGCRVHDDCPYGQHCGDRGTCEAGCLPPDETSFYESSGSCPPGQACNVLDFAGRASNCDSPPCVWECRTLCSLSCEGGYHCFGVWVGEGSHTEHSMCRKPCEADSECDAGYRCTGFVRDADEPWRDPPVTYCARYCSTDAQCMDGTLPRGECRCDSDGICRSGGYECTPYKSGFGL